MCWSANKRRKNKGGKVNWLMSFDLLYPIGTAYLTIDRNFHPAQVGWPGTWNTVPYGYMLTCQDTLSSYVGETYGDNSLSDDTTTESFTISESNIEQFESDFALETDQDGEHTHHVTVSMQPSGAHQHQIDHRGEGPGGTDQSTINIKPWNPSDTVIHLGQTDLDGQHTHSISITQEASGVHYHNVSGHIYSGVASPVSKSLAVSGHIRPKSFGIICWVRTN